VNVIALGIPRFNDPAPYPIAERSVEVRAEEVDRVELLADNQVTGMKG
jgi:hypothetical protein